MRTAHKICYMAEPKHVREVTLTGAADFGFWSAYLKAERLSPVRCGDAAQVLVVSAEMVYLGIRFTEVSVSIRTVLAQDGSGVGMRLLHAFTSSRVFAWCEQTLFSTPYSHGAGRVSVQSPPSMRLETPDGCVLRAEMSPLARPALRAGDENWEGPVFLPPRGAADEGRLFFGRLSGHTTVYPFLGTDHFAMEPSAGRGVFQPLAEATFSPQEWVVRTDATHGKSRTYRRTDIFTHDDAA